MNDDEIYSILVAHCGATERWREAFVAYMESDDSREKEWRFQGKLGFGGKLYQSEKRTYIDCYEEDTPPSPPHYKR